MKLNLKPTLNQVVSKFSLSSSSILKILVVQQGNTEQVTCWRPTDIRLHGTKLSRPGLGISDLTVLKNVKVIVELQIWGTEGGEYEADRLLGNVYQTVRRHVSETRNLCYVEYVVKSSL